MATKKPVILLVDGQVPHIRLVASALHKEYDLRVVKTGRKALELAFSNETLDLILLENQLPDMSGYEVCGQLKQDPITRKIPIIFLASKNTPAEETFALESGGSDFIGKPLHLPSTLARIRGQLRSKKANDDMEFQALVDSLTQIPNRRQFDQSLEREWHRSKRNHTRLALIMIDIDYFKRYNDQHGHNEGDKVLIKVAAILQGCVHRTTDLFARYGGEEFVAILSDIDLPGLQLITEKFRLAVAEMNLPHEQSDVSDVVTISVGAGLFEPWHSQHTRVEAIEVVDDLLYQAKNGGRNQVVLSVINPATGDCASG